MAGMLKYLSGDGVACPAPRGRLVLAVLALWWLGGCAGSPAALPSRCCQTLAEVPLQGLLRDSQTLALDAEATQWRPAPGVAWPVVGWRLPEPRQALSLELVSPLPTPRAAGATLPAPALAVHLLDALGQPLPAPVLLPRAEQARQPQLRWVLDVPAAAERVLFSVDPNQLGQRRVLQISEPGLSQVVAGIRIDGPAELTPVPVQGVAQGRLHLLLKP